MNACDEALRESTWLTTSTGRTWYFQALSEGHISSDYGRDSEPLPVVVIDGREFTWEEFGRMLLSFEGWQFRLEILDPTDEA